MSLPLSGQEVTFGGPSSGFEDDDNLYFFLESKESIPESPDGAELLNGYNDDERVPAGTSTTIGLKKRAMSEESEETDTDVEIVGKVSGGVLQPFLEKGKKRTNSVEANAASPVDFATIDPNPINNARLPPSIRVPKTKASSYSLNSEGSPGALMINRKENSLSPSFTVPSQYPVSGNNHKKRKSIGESINGNKVMKKKLLSCTACSKTGHHAELCHPVLHVPVCGTCHAHYRQRDTAVYDKNEVSCVWCGEGDGANLLMCDSCVLAYCEHCVKRNFGEQELKHSLALETWTCYSCAMPEMFTKLQVSQELIYYSLYAAYSSIKPPKDSLGDDLAPYIQALSSGEQQVAALFCDEILNISTRDLQYSTFLKAKDIFSVIFCLSKPLRRFFQQLTFNVNNTSTSSNLSLALIPGLFQTPYGKEFQCSLHDHQKVSLTAMLRMENQNIDQFGALRGGIFGDEPGLGKTVTALALIAATAGTMPMRPKQFWDEEKLESYWQSMASQHGMILSPVVNRLTKALKTMYIHDHPAMNEFRRKISCKALPNTLNGVHHDLKNMIRTILPDNQRLREEINCVLDNEWNKILSSFDSKQRKARGSLSSGGGAAEDALRSRMKMERELWPSAATLIIVPLALLEHWYEQIMRHLNLAYFTYDDKCESTQAPTTSQTSTSPPSTAANTTASSSSDDSDCMGHDEGDANLLAAGRGMIAQRKAQQNKRPAIVNHTLEEDDDAMGDQESEPATPKRKSKRERQRERLEALRGIVYLDGLGDIVDIVPPVSKLLLQNDTKITLPPQQLSSYLIVVTTLERCISEKKLAMPTSQWSQVSLSPLLQIRWLRLIVDEGHELGRTSLSTDAFDASSSGSNNKQAKKKRKSSSGANAAPPVPSSTASVTSTQTASTTGHSHGSGSSQVITSTPARDCQNETAISLRNLSYATQFISSLAAERRWIMSGTPTTGSNSDEGLRQLFRLLIFLRHPKYTLIGSTSLQDNEMQWEKHIVKPCKIQHEDSWQEVISLLKQIMVRHTKSDIKLYDPIYKNTNLLSLPDSEDDTLDAEQQRMVADDRAKAKHISDTIYQAWREFKEAEKAMKRTTPGSSSSHRRSLSLGGVPLTNSKRVLSMSKADQELIFRSRPPKAIVFSQFHNDLQGVGHFLYQMLGDNAVCEHYGAYQSSELSRFRHNKRKYRCCPLCGHNNPISNDKSCDRLLLLVEYLDVEPVQPVHGDDQPVISAAVPGQDSAPVALPVRAYPGGHGVDGPGGHYIGRCYCSYLGCSGSDHCTGYPNAFFWCNLPTQNQNLALVTEEHIVGHIPGAHYALDQVVVVAAANPPIASSSSGDSKIPLLWRGGRLGGRCAVKGWRKCGGSGFVNSWHGQKVLQRVPWQVRHEDTKVLLLQQEGSTGLDLSFATHIFLLERVHNPGLRNQIISRAHRVGATGPVQVELLQVVAQDQEHLVREENKGVIHHHEQKNAPF